MNLKNKKKLHKILCILLAGILDFNLQHIFVIVLEIPLFLDTTFTMAILFLMGPVEAILSYLVKMLIDLFRLYITYKSFDYIFLYFISAVAIVLVTWLFVRKKERLEDTVNHSFLYLLLASATAAVACTLISGIISYFTYNKNLESWAFDKIIFSFRIGNSGILATSIIGRLPITVLDRVITTFAGFGISYFWKKYKHEK